MTILNSEEIVKEVILREIKTIIYSKDTITAPYVKFTLIANAIEFLGACGDPFPFVDNEQSKTRFNSAIKNYFPTKYHKYANEGSQVFLYEDFRCGMVHQMRPTARVDLTERGKKHPHLFFDEKEVRLYLALEDFYDDLEKAAKKFLKMVAAGKISDKQKVFAPFLQIGYSSGVTQDNRYTILKP